MSTTDLKVTLPDTVTESDARELLAIKLYETGKATLGQAAKVAGFSKRAFLELLGRHKIPVARYSPDELREEISS